MSLRALKRLEVRETNYAPEKDALAPAEREHRLLRDRQNDGGILSRGKGDDGVGELRRLLQRVRHGHGTRNEPGAAATDPRDDEVTMHR